MSEHMEKLTKLCGEFAEVGFVDGRLNTVFAELIAELQAQRAEIEALKLKTAQLPKDN